ncbi:GNAT family N-acetyltransferase [Pseudomonas brassicacearum]|nr:GNAT family N-acetyltransferase [Pseudomonas brassicacearum]
MDVAKALEIEGAEREYLQARVENLARIAGNPYGARVFSNGVFACFQVQATPSPMLNRVYGDISVAPQAILDLLAQTTAYSTVTPIIGKISTFEPFVNVVDRQLERLKGWTHLQLACAIEHVVLTPHAFEIEEVTSQTLPAFADIHASGFRTKLAQRPINQASFAGLHSNESLTIFVIKEAGEVVAGASMYLASNGVAYLGTAVTRNNMRGRGYHRALITHRLNHARECGAEIVAATALPSSQSRRNLQRAGLKVSHAQSLYRLLKA